MCRQERCSQLQVRLGCLEQRLTVYTGTCTTVNNCNPLHLPLGPYFIGGGGGGAEGPWPPHFLVEFIYDPLPFSWPVGSHSWNGRGEGPERLTRSRSRSAIWPRSLIRLQPWESFYTSQRLLSFQCEILERKREVSSCSGDRSGSGCISYDHASCAFYVSGLCAEGETLRCINVRIPVWLPQLRLKSRLICM